MKAIDLFSGCGGLSLGLQNAGFNIVAAYENWQPAIEIYRQNFSHPVHNLDLNNVEQASIDIAQYTPDLIAGGPPCQDFSSAGKRNENGTRGELTISYAHIVATVRPTWFIMENVARLQKIGLLSDVKQILKKAGYGLTEVILDASRCGVPQSRKRLFLIGKLEEQDAFLEKTLLNGLSRESMTVRQFFGNNLQTEYYYRHARSYARRAIFSVDEPSPTIRGVNRPIPPDYTIHSGDATVELNKVRPLTTEERASIQTFPIDFKWTKISKSILEQIIGNAVPVNLGQFVGKAVLSYNPSDTIKLATPMKLFPANY